MLPTFYYIAIRTTTSRRELAAEHPKQTPAPTVPKQTARMTVRRMCPKRGTQTAAVLPAADTAEGSLKANLDSSLMRRNPKYQNPIQLNNQNLTTNVLLKAEPPQRLWRIIKDVLML